MNEIANIDLSSTRARVTGPELRETWLHRRTRMMRVSVSDLEELTEYHTEEVITFGVGSFFLSGAVWLGIAEYAAHGISSLFLFCLASSLFGAVLVLVGLRQV